MILVTGASGTTGGATLAALATTGAPVRALTRDPARLDVPEGVEVAQGSFDDAESLRRALDGVDRAYLVLGSSPETLELEGAFVDAAKQAGVRHLVRLSVIGADQPGSARMRFGAGHQAMEQLVRDSGLEWTFLRPNGFMQNYLGQAATIAADGRFFSTLSPAAVVSHVDARDIGEVAAKALTEDGHAGRAYALTGPEGVSDDQVAERLTAALGKPVEHVLIAPEDLRRNLIAAGVPGWNADGLGELWAFYETGHAGQVAPDVERVLGRPARSFEDFGRDHAAAFSG